MPVKGTRREDSRTTTIMKWYETHPGFFRCTDVAKDLGLTTHNVASLSRYLMERGDIQRLHAEPAKPGGRPIPLYGILTPKE